MHARIAIAGALALLPGALAQPSASTVDACKALQGRLPSAVELPGSARYGAETSNYWSKALRTVQPACIVFPTSAQDVSHAVHVLLDHPDVRYAVKSGGHSPNLGHASVQDGVLIAMSGMRSVTYDKEKGVAYVQPGGTWAEAIAALEPYGVTILGGRIGEVGVGGLLLQGGLSFLSPQHGLAVDNIVGWEVTTANGTTINVDANVDKDLALAMRGSGNQFGIVTKFTVKTHPIGLVWGGFRTYTGLVADQVFAAMHDFLPTATTDPKAAVIVTELFTPANTGGFVVFFFYDGPEPPKTGAFADLIKIVPLIDATGTRKYSDLLSKNSILPKLGNDAREYFTTVTIPYLQDRPGFYANMSAQFTKILQPLLDNPLHPPAECSIDFCPFPSLIARASARAAGAEFGSNAPGLSAADGDRIVLDIQCSWLDEKSDAAVYDSSAALIRWTDAQVAQMTGQADFGETTLPLLMNVCGADQTPTLSYGNYAKVKALQAQSDPEGFFSSKRTGGFFY